MPPKYAKRTDRSQSTTVEHLRKAGIEVVDLSALGDDRPDLLVRRSEWVLLELKERDGKLSRGQVEFISQTRGYVGVAVTEQEAMNVAVRPDVFCLSDVEKARLSAWLLREPLQKSMRVGKFFKLIGRGKKDPPPS